MADPFVAEIRMFGFNFAPTGWAQCNGQLMPISQNTALFSLLGTFFGGNGQTTFALPNIQGSAPMHHGQGAGLSQRFLGEIGGSATSTLLLSELPVHTHSMQGVSNFANSTSPTGRLLGRPFGGGFLYKDATNATELMDANSIAVAGASLPHNNMMQFLVVNFCIALQGVFPQRQ